jgi:hypothetical protein
VQCIDPIICVVGLLAKFRSHYVPHTNAELHTYIQSSVTHVFHVDVCFRHLALQVIQTHGSQFPLHKHPVLVYSLVCITIFLGNRPLLLQMAELESCP